MSIPSRRRGQVFFLTAIPNRRSTRRPTTSPQGRALVIRRPPKASVFSPLPTTHRIRTTRPAKLRHRSRGPRLRAKPAPIRFPERRRSLHSPSSMTDAPPLRARRAPSRSHSPLLVCSRSARISRSEAPVPRPPQALRHRRLPLRQLQRQLQRPPPRPPQPQLQWRQRCRRLPSRPLKPRPRRPPNQRRLLPRRPFRQPPLSLRNAKLRELCRE